MLNEKAWGLVLSGGGGKGAYQAGVLKAITEMGVEITAISGASVGALNATLFATHDIDSIVKIWLGIRPEIALSQERLADLISVNAIPYLMGQSKITCYVDAYNILMGKNEYFRLNDYKGEEIEKLLLASAALPIIYPPVSFQKSLYWDGGMLDNTPIEILYKQGYRNLLVSYLEPEEKMESYKNANVVAFAPTEKWGFFEGTLNFEPKTIQKRIEQGYREAKEKIKGVESMISMV